MKKKIIFKVVLILSLIIISSVFTSAQDFEYKSHTNSSIANYSMPYRLFIPSGYNANTSYPLVLFLHGAGERGTNNTTQLTGYRGATLWAEDANQASYPCFVLAPQCPEEKQWVNTNWSKGSYSIDNTPMSNELKMVKDIIETLETQYNIDASRLYITGLSMGGYGTWDFILRYPEMFKAAIPICGAGDPSKASLISAVPLRVFHSSDDPVVPVSGSRDMVNAINELGPNTRTEFYTEYTDQNHASWINAYNTRNLVDWMFTTDPIKVGLTDITEEAGSLTAQDESQPDVKESAIDNSTNTKWLDLANANSSTRASWIQYHLSGTSYVVTEYTITSAIDFPERDPKNWELLGSNNGSDWTTLDTRTNEEFNSRSLRKTYTFANSVAYTYYKLQINLVKNPTTATGVQLAELEILGTAAVNNITLTPSVLNLEKNTSSQLYTVITPSNASKDVTWLSSNEAVATVSSTGLVNAIAVGLATITATAANNNKTATCAVIVGNGITKYEAENAAMGGTVHFNGGDSGFSGTGFAQGFGHIGDYLEFTLTGVTAGNQDITLRYTTGIPGPVHLYVNGTMIKKIDIITTGGWSNWRDHVDNVNLNAGTNTIRYQSDAGDNGVYSIDYLSIRNVDDPTGIDDIFNDKGVDNISLFPNPLSTGALSIRLPKNATQLSIYDVTGKIIYQKKVMKDEFMIEHSIFSTNGIYLVTVLTATRTINKKVIVAK